jgi:hypothetical protein
MEDSTLSRRQMKQYKEIVQMFQGKKQIILSEDDYKRMRETLVILCKHECIHDVQADGGHIFIQTCDFNHFDEWLKDRALEERKLSQREWRIAIVSAVIGAAVGLVPFFVETIIPMLKGHAK